jgi:hypothetical protein
MKKTEFKLMIGRRNSLKMQRRLRDSAKRQQRRSFKESKQRMKRLTITRDLSHNFIKFWRK